MSMLHQIRDATLTNIANPSMPQCIFKGAADRRNHVRPLNTVKAMAWRVAFHPKQGAPAAVHGNAKPLACQVFGRWDEGNA